MNSRVRTVFLTLGILLVCFGASVAQTAGLWTATGQTANSTENPAAVLLQTGKVLVAGGDLGVVTLALNNAQLFDPATNSWSATGKMTAKRFGLTGTLLPSGRVLIAGGTNGGIAANGYDLNIGKTAELYDPLTGKFTATGKMISKRMSHSATLLPDGRVLVAGGIVMWKPRLRWYTCTNTAEIFDPATETWSSAGTMTVARCGHSMTVMPNGKVLVSGGGNYRISYGSAEIFDPATNSWTVTASMSTVRSSPRAVLLQNGKVLVAGPDTTAELYDPGTGTWSPTGNMAVAHSDGMVMLVNGKVLFAGGYGSGACELYDPVSGTWSATGSFNRARSGAPVTLLSNGNVLVSAGSPVWWDGEIYTP